MTTTAGLGDQGVESVFGMIRPTRVALVGSGEVVDRPGTVDGLLGERSGVRIEDEDAARLTTLSDSADLLLARSASLRRFRPVGSRAGRPLP
ncbi:hypothetical protein ACFCYX_06165 [Streptomyces populi]|uniref:hypothetical protein n=1 Tax=Streptomyces populi TaxID=2058924 RepID=UPI0019D21900|nr:hypothetical protein [Streptomyces populi]